MVGVPRHDGAVVADHLGRAAVDLRVDQHLEGVPPLGNALRVRLLLLLLAGMVTVVRVRVVMLLLVRVVSLSSTTASTWVRRRLMVGRRPAGRVRRRRRVVTAAVVRGVTAAAAVMPLRPVSVIHGVQGILEPHREPRMKGSVRQPRSESGSESVARGTAGPELRRTFGRDGDDAQAVPVVRDRLVEDVGGYFISFSMG